MLKGFQLLLHFVAQVFIKGRQGLRQLQNFGRQSKHGPGPPAVTGRQTIASLCGFQIRKSQSETISLPIRITRCCRSSKPLIAVKSVVFRSHRGPEAKQIHFFERSEICRLMRDELPIGHGKPFGGLFNFQKISHGCPCRLDAGRLSPGDRQKNAVLIT